MGQEVGLGFRRDRPGPGIIETGKLSERNGQRMEVRRELPLSIKAFRAAQSLGQFTGQAIPHHSSC